jgi:hypothetical protein
VTLKPTLIAVIVVLAGGLAASLLFGGKTTTKTVTVAAKTVTVAAKTVTVVASAAQTSTTGDPELETTTETTPPSEELEPTPGFEPVFLSSGLVTIDDTTGSTAGNDTNVTLVNERFGEAQLQKGALTNDSFSFDFESACCDSYAADYYQLEITVPDGATKLVADMGFLKGEASGNTVKVAFYRNEYHEGEQLRQRQLSSASEVAPVDLVVRDASKIIVLFDCLNPGRRWRVLDDDDPSFGFLDAHFE